MKIVEFFCGTKSFSKIAEQMARKDDIIFKVEDVNMIGYNNNEKFYADFICAKKDFDSRVKKAKESGDFAKDEDCEAEGLCSKNGTLNIKGHKHTFTNCYWNRTSNEDGTEYDLYLEFIQIREIKLI
jgi:hypothetical protein